MSVAAHRADQVFLPVLENSVKAQKLRSTLGVFEKSKFLFGLPNQLKESISQAKYDQALRDYKKGSFLNTSKSGVLIPGLPAKTQEQKEQQRRIFEKVWRSVEVIMEGMKTELYDLLQDANRPVEEQEKIIEILIELEGSDEPAWVYLEYQHKNIVNLLRTSHRKSRDRVRALRKVCEDQPSSSTSRVDTLRRQLASTLYVVDEASPTPVDAAWMATRQLVKQISDFASRSLPGFWKIAKSCMDGRYRRRDSSGAIPPSRRPSSTCRTMALEIIRVYTNSLSEFFTLSDLTLADRARKEGEELPIPPFVPEGSTVLTACFFAERIVEDVSDCVGEMSAVEVGGEAGQNLNGMLDNLRWRLEEAIASTWARGRSTLLH